MRRYSHILFDHDGVLVDTEPLYFRATQQHLANLGVTMSQPEFLDIQIEGGNAWRCVPAARQHAVEAERRRRDATYQKLLTRHDIEIDGVLETLAALRSRVRMCIVTTARREDFELIHAERNIVPFMDFVLCREDYTLSKPHPEPYHTALARFGIPASRALVVEDSARGLAAAAAAGIDCAVVHSAFTASQDFSAATFRLTRLADLTEIVDARP